MSHDWSHEDIPDLGGTTAVVTGANSGLGLETARGLAGAGARVVMACRSEERAEAARADVLASWPEASLRVEPLDLASLASVRSFAERIAAAEPGLDLLVNNAGVMALPRCETADGFEMQIGTNHLGHFALTGLLLPALLKRPAARVVTVSSSAHRMGAIAWDDLHGERSYKRWGAYGQSKLANLLSAFELARRLEARGATCMSLAAHPGFSATELQTQSARMEGSGLRERFWQGINKVFAQTAREGALPTLYAATSPDAVNGGYYGPSRFGESWGPPKAVDSTEAARNRADAERLWELSEKLVGLRFFE